MNKPKYEIRREAFALMQGANEKDKKELLVLLSKMNDLLEEAFNAQWGPLCTIKLPESYYSRILDGDGVFTDRFAQVEGDFIPCFKGEGLYHYTWYFTIAPGVTEGAEVTFRHRATGMIISSGHVRGHDGDWDVEMEHPAGTQCPVDILNGKDIDIIIKPT